MTRLVLRARPGSPIDAYLRPGRTKRLVVYAMCPFGGPKAVLAYSGYTRRTAWGSALTHHPHVHMIVPGGGIALHAQRWVSARPAFLLPVRVLGKLFRRLFLTQLIELHSTGRLSFFGSMAHLVDRRAFLRHLAPVRTKPWVVYVKPPFAGPEAVLAYLSRYTQRVAISNHRLLAFDGASVTFRYKDYRRSGPERQQVMTLAADQFIRRFLLHVLPRGFHRIRHYGLLAASFRKAGLALARELLAAAPPPDDAPDEEPVDIRPPCPCCGGHMIVIEAFGRWQQPRRRRQRGGPQHDPARPVITAARRRNAPRPGRARALVPGRSPIRVRTPTTQSHQRPQSPSPGPVHTADRTAQAGPPLPLTQPKIENPHSQRPGPAGSFLGDFRTPARRPKLFTEAVCPLSDHQSRKWTPTARGDQSLTFEHVMAACRLKHWAPTIYEASPSSLAAGREPSPTRRVARPRNRTGASAATPARESHQGRARRPLG